MRIVRNYIWPFTDGISTMAENKTKPTNANVAAYIATVEPARRRADAETLLAMMQRLTGWKPVMWGDSMVGFGRYHYKYASGREGEYFIVGFAPRKAAMSVYIMPGFKQYARELKRLGKHRHSVSCLYLTKLDGLDLTALEAMITDSVRRMQDMYEWWEK